MTKFDKDEKMTKFAKIRLLESPKRDLRETLRRPKTDKLEPDAQTTLAFLELLTELKIL